MNTSNEYWHSVNTYHNSFMAKQLCKLVKKCMTSIQYMLLQLKHSMLHIKTKVYMLKKLMAVGIKVFLDLLVLLYITFILLPLGKYWNKWLRGWELSFIILLSKERHLHLWTDLALSIESLKSGDISLHTFFLKTSISFLSFSKQHLYQQAMAYSRTLDTTEL